MKITSLVAAAALAISSTVAVADTAPTATDAGELVMVEKNGGLFALGAGLSGAALAGVAFFTLIAIAESGGTKPAS